MKERYYILSCSFGKDSLYLLNYLIVHNYPLDEVQFVEPMFDNKTSAILPNHRDFIDYVIKRYSNINFNIIKSKFNYYDLYIKYGCPSFRGCHWCTGWLKTKPLADYNRILREKYDLFYYVGLCSNEKDRVLKNKNKNNIYPLFDNNINEDICFNWCKENNLLSPIYNNRTSRDGCWFCPFQSKLQWFLLKLNYPYLFDKMVSLENERINFDSSYSLVRSKSLQDYINGYLQLSIFDFI